MSANAGHSNVIDYSTFHQSQAMPCTTVPVPVRLSQAHGTIHLSYKPRISYRAHNVILLFPNIVVQYAAVFQDHFHGPVCACSVSEGSLLTTSGSVRVRALLLANAYCARWGHDGSTRAKWGRWSEQENMISQKSAIPDFSIFRRSAPLRDSLESLPPFDYDNRVTFSTSTGATHFSFRFRVKTTYFLPSLSPLPTSCHRAEMCDISNNVAFATPLTLVSTPWSAPRVASAPRVRHAATPLYRRRALRMCAVADEGTTTAPRAEVPSPELKESAGKAEPEPEMQVELDENIAEFCSINPLTGKRQELTVREKEALFLDAAQAYFRGDATLSDAEFDVLKEELTWQGSDVVSLNRDEMRFLDAARAFERGEAMLSDEEFDKLKKKLQDQGSSVAVYRGPRCSIQRKVTFSDVIPDKRRTFALYLPAGLIASLSWLSFSYELTPLHNIDPVLSLIVGSPVIYYLARLLTGLVVPNPQILVGDCPSCGRRTHVLFGNVLNIKGHQDSAEVKCEKCKASLKVERDTGRMILLAEGPKK